MQTERKKLIIGGVAVLAMGLGIGYYAHAAANVPKGIGYAGTLKNNGTPDNATHNFAFDLVDGNGATVGCATDTRTALQVTSGRFSVPNLFTACNTLDAVLASQPTLAVKITVDGQVLTPNQTLATVPYSARSRVGESAEAATGALDTRIAALEQRARPTTIVVGGSQFGAQSNIVGNGGPNCSAPTFTAAPGTYLIQGRWGANLGASSACRYVQCYLTVDGDTSHPIGQQSDTNDGLSFMNSTGETGAFTTAFAVGTYALTGNSHSLQWYCQDDCTSTAVVQCQRAQVVLLGPFN